jgi:hypothetical protein
LSELGLTEEQNAVLQGILSWKNILNQ